MYTNNLLNFVVAFDVFVFMCIDMVYLVVLCLGGLGKFVMDGVMYVMCDFVNEVV